MAVTDLAPPRHRKATQLEVEQAMELAVKRAETLAYVAAITPLHQHLYGYSTVIGPAAESLVTQLMAKADQLLRRRAEA